MRARLILAIAAALLAGLPSTATAYTPRQTDCSHYDGLDSTNTATLLFPGGHLQIAVKPCPDDECRAMQDIACAVEARAHRLTPNTMAYLTPRDAERAQIQYGLNIWALGREHKRRIPVYCRLLARFAATLTSDEKKYSRTASDLIVLAIMMDRPLHHCLAEVLASLPATPALQPVTAWGRDCLHKIHVCQQWTDREYGPKHAPPATQQKLAVPPQTSRDQGATNGQPPWSIGRNACSAGMVAASL